MLKTATNQEDDTSVATWDMLQRQKMWLGQPTLTPLAQQSSATPVTHINQ